MYKKCSCLIWLELIKIIYLLRNLRSRKLIVLKGIVSDSRNIILWHESEDINKKGLFPKFQLIPILRFQVMHDYVWFIAPIDFCVV